jgi:hypothetical protein
MRTGSVSIYPATLARPGDGWERLRFTLTFEDWQPVSPGASTRRETPERARILQDIRKSLEYKTIARTILLNDANSSWRTPVYLTDGDLAPGAAPLEFFFGPKPKEPADSVKKPVALENILAVAHLRDTLEIVNGEVRAITLAGHYCDDHFVAYLESVPGLARLIETVRHVTLEHTALSPDGARRLAALFPGAKVKKRRP